MYLMSTEQATILGVKPKALPTSSGGAYSQCQKCFQPGHWTYGCKNDWPYISRPSRSQQLKNPKLKKITVLESYQFVNPDLEKGREEERKVKENMKKEKSERREKEREKHWSWSDSDRNSSEASVSGSDTESSATGSEYSSESGSSSYSSLDSEDKKQQHKGKQKKRKHQRGSTSSASSDSESVSTPIQMTWAAERRAEGEAAGAESDELEKAMRRPNMLMYLF